MNSSFALDTNILVYLYDAGEDSKRRTSESLVELSPLISSQVVSEYINVTKRLLKLSKEDILAKCLAVFELCKIVPVSRQHLSVASDLIRKYDFQIFDAIIIASLLETDCQIFYSEDMHHGLWVEDQIQILNPFL